MFGLPPVEAPSVDQELHHGDKLVLAGHEASVLHTPGHSPGGVCFSFDGVVVVGDTLFAGSIGRTDRPERSRTFYIYWCRARVHPLPDRSLSIVNRRR
jgi:glyoxylase-like metal-dependent hydrolase (beta-lactamase superfamily II)